MQTVVNVAKAYSLLYEIAQQHPEMKATLVKSTQGAVMAGTGAFLGGLLGGPVGIFVGGALGGAAGAISSKDFKPIWEIIANMTDREKRELAAEVARACEQLGIEYLTITASRLSSERGTQLLKFVMERLQYSVRSN